MEVAACPAYRRGTPVEANLDKHPHVAREKAGPAARKRRAGERTLTDEMCALLSKDEAAALSVLNLLLSKCDGPRLEKALDAKQLGGRVQVRGEVGYTARRSRLSRGRQGRRLDLLFVADSAAVAVEVKLGASLTRRQLADLLAVDMGELGLAPNVRLGVVVLGPRELELSGVGDPHKRLLNRGAVRWTTIIEEMMAIGFNDADKEQSWTDLFGLYLRRGHFGRRSLVRPTPRMALDALAMPLCEHVEGRVGKSVRLDAGKAWHVTTGSKRAARIEMVIDRRRPLPAQRIRILLEARKGRRRKATISGSGVRGGGHPFGAPAGVDPLGALLKKKLDDILPAPGGRG